MSPWTHDPGPGAATRSVNRGGEPTPESHGSDEGEARDHLGDSGVGAPTTRPGGRVRAFSLRAIARDLDMASSAIYRYFPSRDDLLTALIVAAYDSVGDVADQALAESVGSGDAPAESFRAVWRAVRRWALDHRHEYALIFGSPVPGYQAPQATIGAASRLPEVLLTILIETKPAPQPGPRWAQRFPGGRCRTLRSKLPTHLLSDEVLLRALTSWSALFGAISFELFGHTHNVIDDDPAVRDSYFDAQIDLMLSMIGFSD